MNPDKSPTIEEVLLTTGNAANLDDALKAIVRQYPRPTIYMIPWKQEMSIYGRLHKQLSDSTLLMWGNKYSKYHSGVIETQNLLLFNSCRDVVYEYKIQATGCEKDNTQSPNISIVTELQSIAKTKNLAQAITGIASRCTGLTIRVRYRVNGEQYGGTIWNILDDGTLITPTYGDSGFKLLNEDSKFIYEINEFKSGSLEELRAP